MDDMIIVMDSNSNLDVIVYKKERKVLKPDIGVAKLRKEVHKPPLAPTGNNIKVYDFI